MLFPALLARAAAALTETGAALWRILRDAAGFVVARAALHQWEEPCISGQHGSGTVFFSGCSLRCVYCQNQQISLGRYGALVTEENLLRMFDRLIEQGAHNLNLVNPTHYAPMLAKALKKYCSPVPVIYNSGGYERVEMLKALEGLVDIYLPDLKYVDSAVSLRYSGAADYFDYASKAILEMSRQVGKATFDENGVMKKADRPTFDPAAQYGAID